MARNIARSVQGSCQAEFQHHPTSPPCREDGPVDEELLRALCKQIDDGLMALDQALCERARSEGVARREIAVVDLRFGALEAMLSGLSRDSHLWSQFQREVRGPRDVVFDQVYAKAHALGQAHAGPHVSQQDLSKALSFCDAEGWGERISALAEHGSLDGLTVHAVAYVLGGHGQARKLFFGCVEEKRELAK
jgi:hypothetical protein